ncbi:hypothetical protein ONZ45_g17853 [Pleurotus djamor]|nr:hypothetical protein ONZ45_g17853 [Pleurotus djamor]
MFGGMDDFDLLGKAFGAGGDVSDEEEEVEGECVGFGKDTFAMPSPGIRSPWGFMSPTPNSPMMPISPMTPMSPMMSGWPATPRTPGFGGAGGRGGLFRHGAKDHPKLAGLIRKGDLAMSRLGARRDGAGVAGATMRGCDSPGRGPPVYMQSGGGLNISMRTRAYTMGSTSSGVSG